MEEGKNKKKNAGYQDNGISSCKHNSNIIIIINNPILLLIIIII
jgi:hypothetical protein